MPGLALAEVLALPLGKTGMWPCSVSPHDAAQLFALALVLPQLQFWVVFALAKKDACPWPC